MGRRNRHDHRRPAPGGYLSSSRDPIAQTRTDVHLAHELIPKIAAELGWTATMRKVHYLWWTLAAPGDTGHALEITYASGKFAIRGAYPPGSNEWINVANMPSIGVSAHRSAEDIAADIRRRLLPNYWEPFAKVKDARDAHDVSRQRCEANAARLSMILPGSRLHPYANHGAMIYVYGAGLSATVRVQAANSQLTLTGIPTDLAADILALIRTAS